MRNCALNTGFPLRSGGSLNKTPSREICGACLPVFARNHPPGTSRAGGRHGGLSMRFILGASFAILLAGCAGSPLGDAITGPEQLAQRDDAYCKSIGTTIGSPEYANCRMLADQQRANQHAASLGLMGAGASIIANAHQPVYAPSPPPPPTRCRSVYVGNVLQTVCQ
jgi:hypothetical protein